MLNHSTACPEAGRQGESPGAVLCRSGDTRDPGILDHLPSASLTGQELDPIVWGHVAHPTLLGSKVNVLRGLGKPQGEVLLQGGKDEEGLERAKLSPRQRHFPAGVRERVSMRRALQSTWLPHRENLRIFACSFT